MRAIVPCCFSFPFRFPANKGDLNGISTRISNLTFNDYWQGNIRIVIKNESPIQLINLILGAVLVQPWCNQHEKDGICGLDGLFVVHSIERMDGIFPHGKDLLFHRPIRSQTLTRMVPITNLILRAHDLADKGFYPVRY